MKWQPTHGQAHPLSLSRRVLASTSLAASSAGLVALALEDGFATRAFLGLAALVGAGALGIGARRLLPQVLGRGVAWLIGLPMVAAVLVEPLNGHWPAAYPTLFAASCSAALWLSRPGLHTESAKAEFHPVAYRRLFLAGATACAAAGAALTLYAALVVGKGTTEEAVIAAGVGAAFLASTAGVMRMRSWGVLLAMVVSVASIVVAAFARGDVAAEALMLALPGAILATPLFASRLSRPSAAPHDVRLRVGPADLPAPEAVLSPPELGIDDEENEGVRAKYAR